MFYNSKKYLIFILFFLNISTNITAQQSTKDIKWIDGDDFGKSAQIPYWFKESFLEIELDIEEALEEEKLLMLYFHQEGCPYCKATIEKNFSDPTTKDFIQENFDVVEINIRGSRSISLPDGDVVDERAFSKLMKVQYTPTILILDDNGLNEPLERMNGFRPLPIFQETLLVATGKDEEFGFTLESEPNLVNESYFSENYDLSTFIGQKPIAIFIEKKDCAICQQMHREAFASKENYKALSDWHVIQIDVDEVDQEIILPDGTPQNIGDFIEGRVVDFLPTVILYGLGETEETFRMDSYLTNFGVKSTLQYIESGDYKSQPDLQRWSDETRAARRAARGD
ncbi:MAG: thioredoxin fold domain-containing protein, partial [Deltaproteobacteria bacterium]